MHPADQDIVGGQTRSMQPPSASPQPRLQPRVDIERQRHLRPGHLNLRPVRDIAPDQHTLSSRADPISAVPRRMPGKRLQRDPWKHLAPCDRPRHRAIRREAIQGKSASPLQMRPARKVCLFLPEAQLFGMQHQLRVWKQRLPLGPANPPT